MQTLTIKQERAELVRQIEHRLEFLPDDPVHFSCEPANKPLRACFYVNGFKVSCLNDAESMQALATRLSKPCRPGLAKLPGKPTVRRPGQRELTAMMGHYADDPDTCAQLMLIGGEYS